jgi:hypothetical protein
VIVRSQSDRVLKPASVELKEETPISEELDWIWLAYELNPDAEAAVSVVNLIEGAA